MGVRPPSAFRFRCSHRRALSSLAKVLLASAMVRATLAARSDALGIRAGRLLQSGNTFIVPLVRRKCCAQQLGMVASPQLGYKGNCRVTTQSLQRKCVEPRHGLVPSSDHNGKRGNLVGVVPRYTSTTLLHLVGTGVSCMCRYKKSAHFQGWGVVHVR